MCAQVLWLGIRAHPLVLWKQTSFGELNGVHTPPGHRTSSLSAAKHGGPVDDAASGVNCHTEPPIVPRPWLHRKAPPCPSAVPPLPMTNPAASSCGEQSCTVPSRPMVETRTRGPSRRFEVTSHSWREGSHTPASWNNGSSAVASTSPSAGQSMDASDGDATTAGLLRDG